MTRRSVRTRRNFTRSGSRSLVALAFVPTGEAGARSSGVRAAGVAYGGEEEAGREGEGGAGGVESVSIGSTARGRDPKAAA